MRAGVRIAASIGSLLFAAAAHPITASPPPPPPEYIWNAAKLLSAPDRVDPAALAALIADDVTVRANALPTDTGKTAWIEAFIARRTDEHEQVLGFGEDHDSILVIDTYDPFPPMCRQPNMICDARMHVRATRYAFGPDRLVHAIEVEDTASSLQRP